MNSCLRKITWRHAIYWLDERFAVFFLAGAPLSPSPWTESWPPVPNPPATVCWR
jgi:hypothetical protein